MYFSLLGDILLLLSKQTLCIGARRHELMPANKLIKILLQLIRNIIMVFFIDNCPCNAGIIIKNIYNYLY
jgi:hypothetical protein